MWEKSQGVFIFPWTMRPKRANAIAHWVLFFIRMIVDYMDEGRNAQVKGNAMSLGPFASTTLWWS